MRGGYSRVWENRSPGKTRDGTFPQLLANAGNEKTRRGNAGTASPPIFSPQPFTSRKPILVTNDLYWEFQEEQACTPTNREPVKGHLRPRGRTTFRSPCLQPPREPWDSSCARPQPLCRRPRRNDPDRGDRGSIPSRHFP